MERQTSSSANLTDDAAVELSEVPSSKLDNASKLLQSLKSSNPKTTIENVRTRLQVEDTRLYRLLQAELSVLESIADQIDDSTREAYDGTLRVIKIRFTKAQRRIQRNFERLKAAQENIEVAEQKQGLVRSSQIKVQKDAQAALDEAMEVAKEALADFGKLDAKIERLATMKLTKKQEKQKVFRHEHLVARPRLRQYWKKDADGQLVLVRENREHRASWNELFFDLVFVVVFTHLGVDIEHNRDLRGLAEFVVLFTAVWRNWTAANLYINRFDPSDGVHKLYYLVQMVAVMGMIVHTDKGVALSYLLGRGSTELCNTWSAYHDPRVRKAVMADILVYIITAVPWIISLFIDNKIDRTKTVGGVACNDIPGKGCGHPNNTLLLLWGCGLALELIGQAILDLVGGLRIPLNIEHVTERFGLFTIIMLGEQVSAIDFLEDDATTSTYWAALSGAVIVQSFQIFYFDVEAGKQRQHAVMAGGLRGLAWLLTHLVLHMNITLIAAGVNLMLQTTFVQNAADLFNDLHLNKQNFDVWLFCGAEAMSFWCLVVIGLSHKGLDTPLVSKRIRLFVRFLAGAIMLLLALVDTVGIVDIAPTTFLGAAAAVGVVAGFLELYGGVVPRDKHAGHHHNPPKGVAIGGFAQWGAGTGQSAEEAELQEDDEYDTDDSNVVQA